MNSAITLQRHINQVKGKLEAEGIDLQDYDNAVNCLGECIRADYCQQIYENYIYNN